MFNETDCDMPVFFARWRIYEKFNETRFDGISSTCYWYFEKEAPADPFLHSRVYHGFSWTY
jgi:hypothetical protein